MSEGEYSAFFQLSTIPRAQVFRELVQRINGSLELHDQSYLPKLSNEQKLEEETTKFGSPLVSIPARLQELSAQMASAWGKHQGWAQLSLPKVCKFVFLTCHACKFAYI